MTAMTTAILGIVSLFTVLLVVKSLVPPRYGDRLCALCLGVSVTWIGLLTLYWIGRFPHPELVALLMGSTVLGIYYAFEHRVAKEQKLFRLPIYLSLLLLAYSALTLTVPITAIAVTLTIWIVFGILYTYRTNDGVSRYVDRIIACCKDW